MKILAIAFFTTSLFAASTVSFAADAMPDGAMHDGAMHDKCMADQIKIMDANGDGMISKDEYMAVMTKHWESMHMTNGMVTTSDMMTGMKSMHKDCEKMHMSK